MGTSRRRKPRRRRVGRVSYYHHHGGWWVYYQEGGLRVRKHVAGDESTAERIAAQINAQLAASAPTLFAFQPVTVGELQREFIDHHEHVLRSSLATVSRYRTATQHLVNYADQGSRSLVAHELRAEAFVRYLRSLRVSPNGHAHSRRRPLRDKGVRFVLETCRAMYGFAAHQRRMPPYAENPFAGLGGKRFRIEDAKQVFVFDEQQELAFLQACEDWSFPIHLVLATTGLRPGELVHLLIEDIDLDSGWLEVRNKQELGWRVKTGRERKIPLVDEIGGVLRRVIGGRRAGPIFLRAKAGQLPLHDQCRRSLAGVAERRISAAEAALGEPLTRAGAARVCRSIWRDAGASSVDRIRLSFIRAATKAGIEGATCPKSWRHTLATLLQDANVDPLIRQLTLGHAPTYGPQSALGMTAQYTHTRPATQRREIQRALALWPASLALAQTWSQRT